MVKQIVEGFVTTRKQHYFVIPVKTGIQYFQVVAKALDTRLREYDESLHVHQNCRNRRNCDSNAGTLCNPLESQRRMVCVLSFCDVDKD